MSRWILAVIGMLALGGCAMANRTGNAADADRTAAERNDQAERQNKQNKVPPGRTVEPSPWQPPAEVDPVPPPVEGSEPK